ncbi:glycosyltransferase family 87 protein [Nocardioides sp.]|uniref:glycosyltransferase family 87 protein n=1 Tax=Nocardioides sp. TaxID=35761 RepID=UPI002ED5A9CA
MNLPPGGHVHPTQDDAFLASFSEGVGGPVGSRAGRHPWWTPVRVVLALATICLALGLVQKSSCYQASWQNGVERYTHMCYSDLPYQYTGRGLAELSWPYSDDEEVRARYPVMEYPAVIAYWAWGTAHVTHWLSGSPDLSPRYATPADRLAGLEGITDEARRYVAVNAVGLAGLALVAVWLLAGVHRHRPWDAALVAASPALLLTAWINWDLLALVFVAGALWAWSRDRPVLTGVMIGLGTATKLYPLFLLGALLVIGIRERRLKDVAAAALFALVAWGFANLPGYVSGPDEWAHFWTFNSDRGADLGSLWLVIDQAYDVGFDPATINLWSWGLFAVWCLGVLVIGLRAPETPRFAQLGLLILIGFLLLNKVYSPQYVLWLLPLAALARPRWRDHLVWQGGEVFYFAMVWFYLGGFLDPSGGGDVGFYWVAILVRALAELYLVGLVVRDVLRPEHDPVRARPPGPPQSMTTRSNVVAV